MTSSGSKKRPSDLVECELAKRGVWLVKVPRYLSELWDKNPGQEVGRLFIMPSSGKTDIVLKNSALLSSSSTNLSGTDASVNAASSSVSQSSSSSGPSGAVPLGRVKAVKGEVPSEHTFILSDVKNQSLAFMCEDKAGLNEDAEICSGRLSVEGRVVKRADCRPPQTDGYLRMKISQIEKSSQPKRHIKQIDKAEVKFKPVAIHAESIAREKQKKEGAKTVRADKDIVRQAIFHAFEKHQYYRLNDLQKLTNQPPGFVKEILTEIAVYNTMPPHKSMWELKPEYRSYGNVEKKESAE